MLRRTLPFFPLLVMLVFAARTDTPESTIRPEAVTLVIQSMIAQAWTPTVSPTAEPDTAKIVDVLNGAMIDSDPLSETVEAKFNVIDVQFPVDLSTHQVLTIKINVECEWIFTDNCTAEESFVNLMHGLAASGKVFEKINAEVPATVRDMQITTFNHMVQNRTVIIVGWQDVAAFATGKINGNQLGSRIIRLLH